MPSVSRKAFFYLIVAIGFIYIVLYGHLFKMVGVLFALSLMLTVHELGHFLAAQVTGYPVEEFALGMGSTILYSHQFEKTLFTIRAFPLGAFVKMADDLDDPKRYSPRRLPGRICVLLAGSLANIVLAIALTGGRVYFYGQKPQSLTISSVKSGLAADKAGFKAGDLFTHLNGQAIKRPLPLLAKIRENPGRSLSIEVKRKGKTLSLTLTPGKNDAGYGVAGFSAVPTIVEGKAVEYDFLQAMTHSTKITLAQAIFTAKMAWGVIKRLFTFRALPQGVGGPLRVAQSAWSASTMEQLIAITASLSVSIGVFNLLPIPLLDGGRICVALIASLFGLIFGFLRWSQEKQREKLENFEMSISLLGLVCLLGLFVLSSYQDILALLS